MSFVSETWESWIKCFCVSWVSSDRIQCSLSILKSRLSNRVLYKSLSLLNIQVGVHNNCSFVCIAILTLILRWRVIIYGKSFWSLTPALYWTANIIHSNSLPLRELLRYISNLIGISTVRLEFMIFELNILSLQLFAWIKVYKWLNIFLTPGLRLALLAVLGLDVNLWYNQSKHFSSLCVQSPFL